MRSPLDRDHRLLLLEVTRDGHFVPRGFELRDVDAGFDLRTTAYSVWLAFAAVERKTERRQVMLGRVEALHKLDAVAATDGHDTIEAVQLVGDDRLAVAVRSLRDASLVEVKPVASTLRHFELAEQHACESTEK